MKWMMAQTRRWGFVWITLILGFLGLSLSFQNCGVGFNVGEISKNSINETPTPAPTPPADDNLAALIRPNLLPDCATNPQYNACIFWKNPVAQQNSPLSAALNFNSDLSALQIHAVNIDSKDVDAKGQFKNSSFTIVDRETAAPVNGQYKFVFRSDSNHKVGKVMAFFWLNAQVKYMKGWAGRFDAADKSITVKTYEANYENAHWDSQQKEVVMGANSAGNEFALSGDVYLHEMGHANVHYATNGNISQYKTDHHTLCAQDQALCCKTANGCAGAINEGQADYHSAIIYSTSTGMGETWVNNLSGLVECGLNRAVEVNANLSAQQAYQACASFNAAGEIHVAGRVYASIWFEMRKRAAQISGGTAQEIDQLFAEHLPSLTASDTFITACSKIISVSNQLFAGKYSTLVRQECQRRGLNVP